MNQRRLDVFEEAFQQGITHNLRFKRLAAELSTTSEAMVGLLNEHMIAENVTPDFADAAIPVFERMVSLYNEFYEAAEAIGGDFSTLAKLIHALPVEDIGADDTNSDTKKGA